MGAKELKWVIFGTVNFEVVHVESWTFPTLKTNSSYLGCNGNGTFVKLHLGCY